MREAIEDVIIGYAWAYDEERLEDAAALFTADGTLQVSAPGVAAVQGPEAIAAFLGGARAGRAARGEMPRHLVNNVRIVASGDGWADVVSYMTLVVTYADGSSAVEIAGTYSDRFEQVDGAWRIASRRIGFDRDRK